MKSKLTYKQILADLKNKIYSPVYFLAGDEPYYIDKITDYASKHILTEEERSFNQTTLYGKDSTISDVINAAKRFPMMANHQVVIVKEAQEIKEFSKLIHYVEKPLKSTVLIINWKNAKVDGRFKVFQELKKQGVYFISEKLYPDKIPGWIAAYLKEKGYNIEMKAAVLLAEYLGTDLSKLVNELEKLLITLPAGMKIITSDHIEKNIGISKDYNIFELQRAITKRDVLSANRIINFFAENQKDYHISGTLAALYAFFQKILLYHFLKDRSPNNVASELGVPKFFVPEYAMAAKLYNTKKLSSIFSLLRQYDMKSKGYGNVSADAGNLLKELMFKIMH